MKSLRVCFESGPTRCKKRAANVAQTSPPAFFGVHSKTLKSRRGVTALHSLRLANISLLKLLLTSITCICLLVSGALAAEPADMAFHLTVVPVGPENPRNSEAAIIPLKDGSLLLGWTEFYAGSGADHGPARISGKVSTDGGRTWGEKYTLVENDGGCNVMEVNFLRLKDDRIALFYCQKNTESTRLPGA